MRFYVAQLIPITYYLLTTYDSLRACFGVFLLVAIGVWVSHLGYLGFY